MDPTITNAGASRFLFGTFTLVDDAPVFYGAVVSGIDLAFDSDTGQPVSGTVTRIDLQTRSESQVLETHGTYADMGSSVNALNTAFATADTPWFDPSQFFSADLLTATSGGTWKGGAGNDDITVSDRADTLWGGSGDDKIASGDGADLVKDHGGADIIYGGTGNDTVAAGDGNDTLVIDMNGDGGETHIRDFKIGEDSLTLQTGDVLSAEEIKAIFDAGADQQGKHINFDDGSGNHITLLHTLLDDMSDDSFAALITESGDVDEQDILDMMLM